MREGLRIAKQRSNVRFCQQSEAETAGLQRLPADGQVPRPEQEPNTQQGSNCFGLPVSVGGIHTRVSGYLHKTGDYAMKVFGVVQGRHAKVYDGLVLCHGWVRFG